MNKLQQYYLDNPHKLGHDLGYKDLESIHSEWIKYIWYFEKHGPDEEVAIRAHRGSYKTTAIVIIGAIWYLLFVDPNASILLLREEQRNAIGTLEEIRDNLFNPVVLALYREIYGIKDYFLKRDTKKSLVVPTKKTKGREGSIDAMGIGSSLTGLHYTHVHTDDIITLKDRVSQPKRDQVKSNVRELRNIINRGYRVSHTGTPWHKDDGWSLIPNIKDFPVGKVPIKGFMPHEINETLRKLKEGTTASLYTANYELKHIANENRFFKDDPKYIKRVDRIPFIGHLDAKYSGKDTMAYTALGKFNNIIYGYGRIWTSNVVETYDQIADTHNLYKAGSLYTESNKDGTETTKNEMIKRGIPAIGYHESMNKHIKIITFIKRYWHKIYWIDETDPEYLNQIMDYEEGLEPDDAPDSLASLIYKTEYVLSGITGEEIDSFYNQA